MPKRFRRTLALAVVLLLSLSPSTHAALEKKKKKQLPKGTPVLWQEPADIRTRNLLLGPGGAEMRPDLRRVTFIKEERGGYSKKYRVRDAAGRVWVAKIGKEAQSETAAVRLLWAAGYFTEINYLAPRVQILGKGTFKNVRFEARPEHIERLDEWKWKRNPFLGTRAFQGLKVMMVLFNNWDMKDSNNQILLVSDQERGNQLRYIISDLGATFGKTGSLPFFWRITRSRNKPKDYAKAKFIDGIKKGRVNFSYRGKNSGILKDITVADALWIGNLLSQLNDQQIADAFRAANYDRERVSIMTRAVRARINELMSLAG